MNTILGLKLGRRLMAAAVLQDEAFILGDQRYVTSRPASFDRSLTRYLETLLEQVKPSVLYYYAPDSQSPVTARLIALLDQVAGTHGIPARRLTKPELLINFGVIPIRSRRQLREVLQHLWDRLQGTSVREAVLAEAAAAALVGEVWYHQLPG